MDPLEWGVRKTLSIPKAYYWQTGNYKVSMRTKLWHQTIYSLGALNRCAESVGECVANLSGLNSSEFSYVTDNLTEEEWEVARKEAKQRAEIRDEERLIRKEQPSNIV